MEAMLSRGEFLQVEMKKSDVHLLVAKNTLHNKDVFVTAAGDLATFVRTVAFTGGINPPVVWCPGCSVCDSLTADLYYLPRLSTVYAVDVRDDSNVFEFLPHEDVVNST